MALNGKKLFFVLSPADAIVFGSADMSVALEHLHTCVGGSRLVRNDGVVLAYMTSESIPRGRLTLTPRVKKLVKAATI